MPSLPVETVEHKHMSWNPVFMRAIQMTSSERGYELTNLSLNISGMGSWVGACLLDNPQKLATNSDDVAKVWDGDQGTQVFIYAVCQFHKRNEFQSGTTPEFATPVLKNILF